MSPPPNPDQSGISEALRKAVEATFSATAGSAQETRERASELLDDAVRRSRDARDEVLRRGEEVGSRVESELRSISERLAKLEATLRRDRR